MNVPSGRIFHLKNSFVNQYRNQKPDFGFNGLGELVYRRTYSRLQPDGTREQFYETIKRVVEGCFSIQRGWMAQIGLAWDEKVAQAEAEDMFDRFFKMKALAPGRGLWAMGSSITTERAAYAALSNCAFISTDPDQANFDPAEVFCFIQDFSMLGVGVGFDTAGAGKIDVVEPGHSKSHVIADSREGWVDSLRLLLNSFFKGGALPVFDYSEIRPPGQLIRGFGGISQGAQPLQDLHESVVEILKQLVGSNMTSAAIVDVANLVGKCTVSGNVRRSAEIAIGDPQDLDFLELKNYDKNPYRAAFGWASNNSVSCSLGEDYERIAKSIHLNGEPGLIWLQNMRQYGRMCDPPNNKDWRVVGVNPCITKDTIVLTDTGLFPVSALINRPFNAIVDGVVYPSSSKGFWSTGVKPVFKVTLDNGLSIKATGDHRILTTIGWVETGSLTSAHQIVLSDNSDLMNGTSAATKKTIQTTQRWLKNLFDYNGHVGYTAQKGVKVTATSPEAILRHCQLSLLVFGITSTVVGSLLAIDDTAIPRFTNYIGFSDSTMASILKNSSLRKINTPIEYSAGVITLEAAGSEEVFDCSVPGPDSFSANGIIAHNCSEQSLESAELCCLVETFPDRADDLEDYLQSIRTAILYAKTVTLCATGNVRTNEVMLRNRRIGCSMSGIAQFLAKHGIEELRQWCEAAYQVCKEEDVHLSERWCVPQSVKLTSIKPSGTVSLLAGATPGMHFPESSYYIRRVRIASDSELLGPLENAGYHVEDCVYAPNTKVVSIPVSVGDGVRVASDVSMWEQLGLAAFLQKYWADNQVSCTVTFDPETEGRDIVHALNLHQYDTKGTSFLPRAKTGTTYAQSPYEAISKEEYEEMAAELGEVKYTAHTVEQVTGLDDDETVIPESERFCSGDKCMRPV